MDYDRPVEGLYAEDDHMLVVRLVPLAAVCVVASVYRHRADGRLRRSRITASGSVTTPSEPVRINSFAGEGAALSKRNEI